MSSATRQQAFEEHLGRLEEMGWFDQYSEGDPRAACRAHFEDGLEPHWCIPSVQIDIECVYDEGIHEEVVREVIDSAHGLLSCERIVETWGGSGRGTSVDRPIAMQIHLLDGRVLEASWVQEGDFLSERFGELLVAFVEAHSACIDEVEAGHWIVGRAELLEQVMRLGQEEDRAIRARQVATLEAKRRPRMEPTAAAERTVPMEATREELEAWWLFNAGFYLTGARMRTWRMMFGDAHAPFQDLYIDTMNRAFAALPPGPKRALVARQISDAGQSLLPHHVAEAMGMPFEDVVAQVEVAQAALRLAGATAAAQSPIELPVVQP